MVWALAKAAGFIALVLVAGVRVLPWLLLRIARTRSRELFLLAVFSLAASTAFAAYELFGVSFALGAFLAGVVIGGTRVHHQVEAEVVPFRDLFAVLFFVSVGMAVDLAVVVDLIDQVLLLTVLIVVGKTLITLGLAVVMPRAGRDLVIVAAGLAQIGEFSFIVGQAGLGLGLIDSDKYAVVLAAAVLSIMVNPVIFRLVPVTERRLLSAPFIGPRMRRSDPGIAELEATLEGHVVVVGFGRVGHRTVQVLREIDSALLVIDLAAPTVEAAEAQGLLALFGDASNSDILDHAGLRNALALVVTLPDQTDAELVVAAAHDLAPDLPIVARAGTLEGVQRLHRLGARHVINPELEGGLEIVRHTLLELDFPLSRFQPYVDAVRRDAYQGRYGDDAEAAESAQALDQLLTAVRGVDLAWQVIPRGSSVAGSTLDATGLRRVTGASVVAIMRNGEVVANPSPTTTLGEGDLLGLIGEVEELAAVDELLAGPTPTNT